MRPSFMVLTVLCLTLAGGPAWAKPGDPRPGAAHALSAWSGQFVERRAEDLKSLVLGPTPPAAPAELSTADCATLYTARVALMRQQYDYRPAFTEDPRNQVATAFGFVSSVSFAFLPFTAIQSYLDDTRKSNLEARLDVLRQASARQQCYQR